MPSIHLILLSSALTLAALPGWAETGSKKAPAKQARPLNLSLPRDVLMQSPARGNADETVMRNLRAPAQTGTGSQSATGSSVPTRPASLPYGAGFEHRHQGMGGGAGHGAGAGGGAGGGGAGRHGR